MARRPQTHPIGQQASARAALRMVCMLEDCLKVVVCDLRCRELGSVFLGNVQGLRHDDAEWAFSLASTARHAAHLVEVCDLPHNVSKEPEVPLKLCHVTI